MNPALEQLLAIASAKDWAACVGLGVWLAIALAKRVGDDKIPEGWRWLRPVVLAGLVGAGQGLVDGLGWHVLTLAIQQAVLAGVGAMGLHSALTESPLPYGGGAGGETPEEVVR